MARDLRRALVLTALLFGGAMAPALAQTGGTEAQAVDPRLKALRRQMTSGAQLATADLRDLANSGDGLAAFRYAQRLDATPTADGEDMLRARLHYYALSTYAGRDFAAARLIALVDEATARGMALKPAQLRSAEDALLAAAARGSSVAALGLSRLYLAGAPFGPKPDAARGLVQAASRAEGPEAGRAALTMALAAIGGDPAHPADSDTARQMLQLAAESRDLAARAMALNLLPLLPPDAKE